jgi:hypothetical protein
VIPILTSGEYGYIMKIQVLYISGSTIKDISDLVVDVSWTGDITACFRQLDVKLNNTRDGQKPILRFEKGKELRFIKDGIELFRGIIFKDDISEKGEHSITAYDENVYLTKSTDTKKYTKIKASAIIRDLCNEFGVPIGNIVDTKYVIPRLILKDKSLWEMMGEALTLTTKMMGTKYVIYSKEGKLYCTERVQNRTQWVLEDGVNITGASYSQSIEDMATQVEISGTYPVGKAGSGAKRDAEPDWDKMKYSWEEPNPDESQEPPPPDPAGTSGDTQQDVPYSILRKNNSLISKFGIMQKVEDVSGEGAKARAEQRAAQILKEQGTIKDEARVDALGIHEVTSGKTVLIKQEMTGIRGVYYVITDQHTFSSGNHTMSVSIASSDDVIEATFYGSLDQDTAAEDTSSGGSSSSSSKKKDGPVDWDKVKYSWDVPDQDESANP